MTRLLMVALAALALAACGQREQVAQAERGYQGKPDSKPWEPGTRASWEAQIKRRQLAQHEDTRIND